MNRTQKMIFTAVCMALCVVLPGAFHWIPNAGSIFLPMHIPVLLCGLACGWTWGMTCGVLGPVLSFLITAMPPAAVLPSMTVECAVYGCVTGFMLRKVHTGRPAADLYISMGTAMVLGRALAGISKALLFTPGIPVLPWMWAALVTGLPGICIQLVLIPLVLLVLQRARLLPKRSNH